MIRFSTLDVEMPPIDPQRDKAWISQVVESYGKMVGELYYYFCSDEKLLEINRERLGHDFYTDIVTFPLTDCVTVLSSEFCISIDRIKENAVTFGRSYESELHRVIIHGVLHLIGFDDLTDEEEREMREQEEEALNLLTGGTTQESFTVMADADPPSPLCEDKASHSGDCGSIAVLRPR
ncbi:MAG: rRNA maturation RNase YbeY [Bacteroidales bacterium]|nr:rRNA maturation RNase YbeY [Bacteroidales bacterium]